ncbi:MAG TPA: arsenosugar biosynthesis radical SAM (seleno)protein ArsS [Syntrophorhabdaceae bacterium]|nr:arsenosugar biosynthesis radical SAM (seleno)protein ArsS [Syntrophorhabdaceae bacterium]
MNEFDKRVGGSQSQGLFSRAIDIFQVNLGLKCNQQCVHCHHEASPSRLEQMEWQVMELIVAAAQGARCQCVDLTGGAPELNPHFRDFVDALRGKDIPVQVRTNLTVFFEPTAEGLPEFLREREIRLVASLPCYTEENVCAQRGEGVYGKSIAALTRLNALGYGLDPALPLNLVYNPGGSFLPYLQASLEQDYRRELNERSGIHFTNLLTITNMPLGRFRKDLLRRNEESPYLALLKESFNPETVPGLMCRNQISVGWDGTLYDCDFNLALDIPLNHGAPDQILNFSSAAIEKRRIMTGDHCFGCTAGAGSSCSGSIVTRAAQGPEE